MSGAQKANKISEPIKLTVPYIHITHTLSKSLDYLIYSPFDLEKYLRQ